MAKLQGENQALSSLNTARQRELDTAHMELDAARRRVSTVEAQLRNCQDELSKLRKSETAFREIILERAGIQDTSDDTILNGFLKLRQDVQKLSRSPSCSVEIDPALSTGKQGQDELKGIYSPATWGNLGVSDRRLRLRAWIFDELHSHILDYNCFGLEGVQASDGTVAKGKIEPGLQRFEQMLQDTGGKTRTLSSILESPPPKEHQLTATAC